MALNEASRVGSVSVDTSHRQAFRKSLVAWYESHRRDLPWRHTKDPYAIAVSEMMLQQTQVATVMPYYHRWLSRFPHWQALARAGEDEVLKAWEGLGYYRRARNLHRLAQVVAADGGELPGSIDRLEELPGIGPYTARAIGSIAFDLPAAVIDGNVMRVLARVFAISEDISKPPTVRHLQALGDLLRPERGCGQYNQAIMELGALVCTPRHPICDRCPLAAVCHGRTLGPDRFPVKTRAATEKREETVAVLRRGPRIWCEPTPTGQRLESMWRLPEADSNRMRLGPEMASFTYSITRFRVRLHARLADWIKSSPPEGKWLTLAECRQLPFSAAHRRLLAIVFS
jgi:A/G-specific adenine glycosylase